jgi:hypothetical protein
MCPYHLPTAAPECQGIESELLSRLLDDVCARNVNLKLTRAASRCYDASDTRVNGDDRDE